MEQISSKWVDINKTPPERFAEVIITDGTYIATAEYTGISCGHHSFTGNSFGGYGWDWYFDEKDITHWMPTPELPKKEAV